MLTPIRIRARELRESRGWTQAELAEKSGVRVATLSAIENGRTKGIDFDTLERLAAALGVDPALLVVQEPAAARRKRGR